MLTNFKFDIRKKVGLEKLCCVECKESLELISTTKLICRNKHEFKVLNNIPILLSKNSEFLLNKGQNLISSKMMIDEYNFVKKTSIRKFIKRITAVPNIPIRMFDSNKILNLLTDNENPNIFVLSIGGGPRRDRKNIINLNIDTFPNVEIVGDAHNLPFKNNSVDSIVINAVLEHVKYPNVVVKEIFRVLKKRGYVLAETPFLQHYHGYPLHFQNYTLTGHNFLFKKFKILNSGPIEGPFSTVSNITMNLPEDLISNKYIRKVILYLVATYFLPIRILDLFLKNNQNVYKLTSGVFLLAQKK